MPRRVVRQPNGLFAMFSTIVDDFVIYGMSEEQAYQECHRDMGVLEARAKVLRGMNDEDEGGRKGDGLSRWRDCLDTIRIVHGGKAAREREAELSRPVPAQEATP